MQAKFTEILDRLGYPEDSDISKVAERIFNTVEAQTSDGTTKRVASSLVSDYYAGGFDVLPTNVQWVPFQMERVEVGDTIRVRMDAYDNPLGARHNGLAGSIAAIRGGRVIVKYFGRIDGTGVPHQPELLEMIS